MNYEEVSELLDYIQVCYGKEVKSAQLYAWLDVLQPYDKEEVWASLKEARAEERFQTSCPQVQYIVRNLVKKYDRVDYSKQVIYCPICSKPLNQPDFEKHFDRCSSVDYVIRNSKKWFNSSPSKKALFEMPDSEFEEKYNQLLKYIYEHTSDSLERETISFIFNSPTDEKAKQFLSKGRKI